MAAENTQLFTDILSRAPDLNQRTMDARLWLREQAQQVRSVSNPRTLVTGDSERLVTSLTVGRMYLFAYDPKFKDELPFYDRFPLIFPFKRVQGGFYGINMHYLPPLLRAKLMDGLYTLANNRNNDDTTKLKLSYALLESSTKYKYFKPCVKHYLNNHVKSRFLWIPTPQWETALFLPLERFVGASKQQVWRQSRRMVTT